MGEDDRQTSNARVGLEGSGRHRTDLKSHCREGSRRLLTACVLRASGTSITYCFYCVLLGSASKSLKYCRFCNSGRRSPSIEAAPRLLSANRSCQPGSGTLRQWRRQASSVPRIEKE